MWQVAAFYNCQRPFIYFSFLAYILISWHLWFVECSTTESSDDIEKQELEEVSDEDEMSFHDSKEYFTEPNVSCGSIKEVSNHLDNYREAESECDVAKVQNKREVRNSRYPHIERRKKLPDPVEKEKGVSLWSMIKDNVGKDLTRVCLPVYFNEPISSLQKCCEDLEYSFLLDQAYEYGKAVSKIDRHHLSLDQWYEFNSFLAYIYL